MREVFPFYTLGIDVVNTYIKKCKFNEKNYKKNNKLFSITNTTHGTLQYKNKKKIQSDKIDLQSCNHTLQYSILLVGKTHAHVPTY